MYWCTSKPVGEETRSLNEGEEDRIEHVCYPKHVPMEKVWLDGEKFETPTEDRQF